MNPEKMFGIEPMADKLAHQERGEEVNVREVNKKENKAPENPKVIEVNEKLQNSGIDQIRQRIGDRLFDDIFSDGDYGEFYKKVIDNKRVMDELAVRPFFIYELSEYRGEIFDDPKKFESFFRNSRERETAYNISKIEFQLRLKKDPFASEEELAAGIYKEYIEPQVRDAVFAIRRKGYGTFESGFYNLIEGSQYIGFAKDTLKDFSLPPDRIEALKSKGVEISIETTAEDRDSLFLKPIRDFDLDQWKKIWDEVVEIFPNRGIPASPGNNKKFIEKQENMKAGKRVYLGKDVFFEKGKVTLEE